MGDYAATADFETFLARNQVGGVRNDIARLSEQNDSGLTGTVDVTFSNPHEGYSAFVQMKVYDYEFTGAQRGKNISEDGQVWVKIVDAAGSSVDAYDEYNQLADWNFSARSFGDETDGLGKVHVSVVKDPSSYVTRGGTKAVIDATSIIIDGADDTNTDDGTLYVKVTQDVNTDGSRDFTVELYSNSARTTREASGSVSDIEDTEFPVEIELTADTGGVDGSLELDAFNSTQDGVVDSTVQIDVPRYFVRLYRDAGRAEDDMISEGVSYETTATNLALSAVGSYSTAGDVDLVYVQDDVDIELTMNFYYLDMYRTDPDDSDTTDDDIVARAGSDDPFHTVVTSADLYAANNSGLTDVSVKLDDVPVSAGFVTSVVLGYTAGDKFTFATSVTDDSSYTPGRFQTFLRDSYTKVFSSEPEGTSNTVPDSWAGAS